MVVTIDGVGFVVASKQNAYLHVPLANGSTMTFRRNNAGSKETRRCSAACRTPSRAEY